MCADCYPNYKGTQNTPNHQTIPDILCFFSISYGSNNFVVSYKFTIFVKNFWLMLLNTLIIVAILLTSYLLMSTDRLNHINRAALAMFTGVVAWVVLLIGGENIHNTQLNHYIQRAVEVILFLIATNTIIEIMHNNGVFDSLKSFLRTSNSKVLLWYLSIITFAISANVDNLTTVVLMMSIMTRIVRSHSQRVIYGCVILISANLGGSFTVIGDMTNLMMWGHGVITPTEFAAGLILPVLASLMVFNLLIGKFIVGRVEVASTIGVVNDDVYLPGWQKILMLVIGLASIWFVPSFSRFTGLPPFIGALTALALILMMDGAYNFRRNGNQLFVNRKYMTSNEYVSTKIALYFLGSTLGVGALVECGSLDFIGQWLNHNVHNVYIYGGVIGLLASVIDNIPFVLAGIHLFPSGAYAVSGDFAVDGAYWQLLSFCSALGASLLYLGSLAGHSVAETVDMNLRWYFRHVFWRVMMAWCVGMIVFYVTHL